MSCWGEMCLLKGADNANGHSIARVSQYTINIFYLNVVDFKRALAACCNGTSTTICDKNRNIKRTISHYLRKSQNSGGNDSFGPKKWKWVPHFFIFFYKIWVKYVWYAFFKCYMEMARKCYNIRYNFIQSSYVTSVTQFFAFFLRKGQI